MEHFSLLSIAAFIFALIYIITVFYLKHFAEPEKTEKTGRKKIAVLIAMRNEEKYIGGCLCALETQNYPSSLFDVYVIDDRSTDRSTEIVQPFLQRNGHFHLISIKEDRHQLFGKMNVLAQAIAQINHDIILITDADCIVPPGWIETYAAYFKENTGLVGGLTMLDAPPNVKVKGRPSFFFGKVQAVDWLFLQLISAGAANAGRPVTVLGNNFGFRRAAYLETGGFESLGFSVTEDMALLKAIEKLGKWKIKLTLDLANTIFSYPVNTLSEFIKQRQRWIIGGKSMRPFGYLLAAVSTPAKVLLFAALLLFHWNVLTGVSLALILGADYRLISRQLKKLKMRHLKKYFLPFEIFLVLYSVFFSLTALLPQKVHWKGRKF